MVACVVGAEVVSHRSLGMFYSNVIKTLGTTVFRGPEEHFEIYHVVHDSVVASEHYRVAWPREDGADVGVIESRKSVGGSYDNIAEFWVLVSL